MQSNFHRGNIWSLVYNPKYNRSLKVWQGVKIHFRYKDTGRNFQNDQYDFFAWAEDMLTNTMAIEGRSCIQRLICEISAHPIDHLSFLGDLIHYLIEWGLLNLSQKEDHKYILFYLFQTSSRRSSFHGRLLGGTTHRSQNWGMCLSISTMSFLDTKSYWHATCQAKETMIIRRFESFLILYNILYWCSITERKKSTIVLRHSVCSMCIRELKRGDEKITCHWD